jgi:hypothetical protein
LFRIETQPFTPLKTFLSPFGYDMDRPDTPQPISKEASTPGKPRIQTQIHRRQKAKAVPPMEDEWDAQSKNPPNLRTPSSKMKKS